MPSLLTLYIYTRSVMGSQLWCSLWVLSNERLGPDHFQVCPRCLIFWDFAVTLPRFCREQIQRSWFWSEATVENRCPALPRALGSGVPGTSSWFTLLPKELVSGYPFCFPAGAVVKNLPAKAADPSSTPGSGRSHAGGKSNPLGNPMDRGAWQAIQRIWVTVHTRTHTHPFCQWYGLSDNVLQHTWCLSFSRELLQLWNSWVYLSTPPQTPWGQPHIPHQPLINLFIYIKLHFEGKWEQRQPMPKGECKQMSLLLSLCSAAQLCPILWDPMNHSPPGSSVHGILQARRLEWVAISSSRGSSCPRDRTSISCIGGFFTSALAGRPSYVTFNSQRVTPVTATSLHIHLVQTRDPGTHHSLLPAAQGPDYPALHIPQDPLAITSHSCRIKE